MELTALLPGKSKQIWVITMCVFCPLNNPTQVTRKVWLERGKNISKTVWQVTGVLCSYYFRAWEGNFTSGIRLGCSKYQKDLLLDLLILGSYTWSGSGILAICGLCFLYDQPTIFVVFRSSNNKISVLPLATLYSLEPVLLILTSHVLSF